jgi:hypothetical protein
MSAVDRAAARVPWWANLWPFSAAYRRGLCDGLHAAREVAAEAVS